MADITPQPGIMDIALYVGGASSLDGVQDVVKLSSNENPFGPSPRAKAALAAAAERLHRYPSTDHAALRGAISEVHGLQADNIICGVGSDEIIHFLCQAYVGPGHEVIHTEHGFAMYRISTLAAGGIPVEVAEHNRRVDVDAILAAVTPATRLVFIANPANPTATFVPMDEITRLADGLPDHVILVLDGAYAEFEPGYDGGAALAEERRNVVMTRTFSKLYGLGGLRVGYGYGPGEIIEVLNRIRGPFNLSGPALAAAEAAVRDHGFREFCLAQNARLREVLRAGLEAAGVACDESHANFVLARFDSPAEAEAANAFLQARGLIVRQVGGYGLPECLRITVGDETACARVIEAITDFKGGQAPKTGSTQAEAPLYDRVALIGLGLIASSMFWAMQRAGLAGHVTGYARSAETRDTARRIGLTNTVCDSAAEAVAGADLVVLAVPVGAMSAVMQEIAPHLTPGATVIDVGSVKRAVIDAVLPHMPEHAHFVPCHPMAGTEHSGPESGFAELFDNRWCLIVPPRHTDPAAIARVERYWHGLGSDTNRMEIAHHDRVCAVVSHIPHLIAYTMVGVADDLRRVSDREVIKYSAAGFRDFTRIAASDPTMWRDVFLSNKEATLEILGRFTEELFALQRSIRTCDGDHLFDYFTRTRAIRRGIIEAGQDTDAADFGRGSAR